MFWVSFVLIVVEVITLALMWRVMYRNYGRYGRADHGNMQPLIAILLLTINAQQIVDVTRDPSQTITWVALGIGIICSVFCVASMARTRRSA